MKRVVLWVGAILLVTAPLARADDAREKAVKEADKAFLKAYNAGDAKAVAALFTEDAEEFDEHGGAAKGRKEIEELYTEIFEDSPGSKLEITLETLRFPTDDVALATGRSKLTSSGGGTPEVANYTVLYVKKDGRWLQSFVRETLDKRVSPHERLKELAWMNGEWVDEGSDGVVFTTGHWSDDKNFLLREFTLHIGGKPALTASQRIGWDPGARQFKSWVFDSEGGHSEGYWSHDGDRWVVKTTGVLPDGRKTAATQVFTIVNDHTVRWKVVDQSVGSQALSDDGEIILVRKPPKPR